MIVSIQLFGAFRQFHHGEELQLACPGVTTVADVRAALDAYGVAHWPGYRPGLLRTSAFASPTTLLRDGHPVPDDGRLAVLPPVSGG